MQVCSSDLCYRQVGSPLDEHVPESEPFPEWTLQEVRGEELLPNRCVEMPGELRLGCRWDEPGEGIGRERRADHGYTRGQLVLLGRVDPVGPPEEPQSWEEVRRDQQAVVRSRTRELFKEERISASSSCQLLRSAAREGARRSVGHSTSARLSASERASRWAISVLGPLPSSDAPQGDPCV